LSLKQHIQTDQYDLSVPKEWEVIQLAGGYLTFQKANKYIGALEVLGFYPGQTISNLVPNGAEILALRQVEGVQDAYEVRVRIFPPAASPDQTLVEQTHFYYLKPDLRIAYDLYFQSHEVSEHIAVEVAKSFVSKK
jgi:hypothetical protein